MPQNLFNSLRLWAGFLLVLCGLVAPAGVFASNLQGSNGSFKDLALVDGGVVGIGLDNSIQYSSDGGLTFTELRPGDPEDALESIAASGTIVIAGGNAGWLLRSDIGVDPQHWSDVSTAAPVAGSVTGIAQNGLQTWVAVTSTFNGAILRSTDSDANSWAVIDDAPASELHSVVFDSASSRWVAVGGDGFGNGTAYYSTDGLTWTVATLPGGSGTLWDVAADSFGNILAVAEADIFGEGTFLRSVDGGATYSFIENAPSETFTRIVAVGEDEFVAAGLDGQIISISDELFETLFAGEPDSGTSEAILAVDGSVLLSGVEPVEAPVIDPNGGNFEAPVLVTLVGPDGADVFYTIDGSQPTVQSTLYTGAFNLESTVTLRAVAMNDGIASAVVSADFIFATLPDPVPALQITVIDASNFQIELPESQSGLSYQLQSSELLQTWDPLQAVQAGTGSPLTWTVPVDGTRRFYRVLISD